MSRVSLADGTKPDTGDSPYKAYYSHPQHTNAEFNLEVHRGELRYNMRRKIVMLEFAKFLTCFTAAPACTSCPHECRACSSCLDRRVADLGAHVVVVQLARGEQRVDVRVLVLGDKEGGEGLGAM